jgi:hypothetical protein
MLVQTNYNWNQARASRFNSDKIRRSAVKVSKNTNCLRIQINQDVCVNELKEWFTDNELTDKEYSIFGVFDDRRDRMYFAGLAFEFQEMDVAILFKLRFQ